MTDVKSRETMSCPSLGIHSSLSKYELRTNHVPGGMDRKTNKT